MTSIPCLRIIVMCAGLWAIGSGQGTRAEPVPRLPALEVAHCRVVFVDRRMISAGSAGVIAEIVDEGDRVNADAVLIQLQNRVPQAALAVAEAKAESDVEIRLGEKASEAAQLDLAAARVANSLAPDAYARVEVERLRVTQEQADLETEKARQQLKIAVRERDQAAAELNATRIVAPLGGLITKRLKSVGEGVQPADPILELVNTQRVRIEGYVPVEQVWKLKVGQTVQVQLDLGGDQKLPMEQEIFTGKLGFVDVTVQSVAGTVRVWAEVENRKDLLKDGLSARMSIEPGEPNLAGTPQSPRSVEGDNRGEETGRQGEGETRK